MKFTHLLIILNLALLCISVSYSASIKGQTRKNRFRKRSNKRLRFLRRFLKRLRPSDVFELTNRSKKDRSYDDDSFEYVTHPSYHEPPLQSRQIQIECPKAEDGMQLFACPTPDRQNRYKCIDDHALCDNVKHCPNGEDEDKTVCMFHKMTMNFFSMLMNEVFFRLNVVIRGNT